MPTLVHALELLVFTVGVVLFVRPQIRAGARPTLDTKKWTPVFRHPVYGKSRSLRIGACLMVLGGLAIAFFH